MLLDSGSNKTNSKELDLIECHKNYGWRFITLYIKVIVKTIRKEVPKGKMVTLGGINYLKKERHKKQAEKERYIQESRFQEE